MAGKRPNCVLAMPARHRAKFVDSAPLICPPCRSIAVYHCRRDLAPRTHAGPSCHRDTDAIRNRPPILTVCSPVTFLMRQCGVKFAIDDVIAVSARGTEARLSSNSRNQALRLTRDSVVLMPNARKSSIFSTSDCRLQARLLTGAAAVRRELDTTGLGGFGVPRLSAKCLGLVGRRASCAPSVAGPKVRPGRERLDGLR
ncbi:hypothetical protein ACVWXO_000255 [Bradyrhizobium sp. LM2.7]